RYLIRRLRNSSREPCDVAQETWVRLLSIENERLVRKPVAYLFGIAKNVVREFARLDAREPHHLQDARHVATEHAEDGAEPRQEEATQDDPGDHLDLQRQLRRALEALPPLHRAVVLYVKRDGMTYREAGAKLGLTPRTVERYLSQALTQIQMMPWDR